MSATRLRPATVSAICLMLGWSAAASAQSYPNKPIHIVVPVAPGGITDVLARALAHAGPALVDVVIDRGFEAMR